MLGRARVTVLRVVTRVVTALAVFAAAGLSGVVVPVSPAVAAESDLYVEPVGGAPTLTTSTHLAHPPLGIASTATGLGYWVVATDGGIFSYGDASFYGSTGAIVLNRPVVGLAATPTGHGYWLVASDGGVFAFGDAAFYGSTGAITLNEPVVGMAATPSGLGYWLFAGDGGIFAFGDAGFFGSTGAIQLEQPILSMAPTPTGQGYWMVAVDGGVFAFGDAGFFGSAGATPGATVVAMAAADDGKGYHLVRTTGEVLNYGSAPAISVSANALRTVVGAARPRGGRGLWLVGSTTQVRRDCVADPAGDPDGPGGLGPRIDVVEVCVESLGSRVSVSYTFRTARSAAALTARMKAPASSPGGYDFFRVLYSSGPQRSLLHTLITIYGTPSGLVVRSLDIASQSERTDAVQLDVRGATATFTFNATLASPTPQPPSQYYWGASARAFQDDDHYAADFVIDETWHGPVANPH